MKKILCIVFLLFGPIYGTIIKCELNDNKESNCIITGPRSLIDPSYDAFNDTKNVIAISFNNFEMVNLTSEWCAKFVNLKEFRAENVSLKRIEPNAFDGCGKLKYLDLRHNNLTHLDKNVFKFNRELEGITLQDNNFEKIDVDMFIPTNKLKFLALNEMQGTGLTDFPSFRMPFLPLLEKVTVDSNAISDLDEDEILRKFPKLKTISIDDNPFHCVRLQEMLGAFEARNVKVLRWDHHYRRSTKYPLKQVGEADCLENEQFDKQNPVDERIFAIRDETKWIRKQLRHVNATLYEEINSIKNVTMNENAGQYQNVIQNLTEISKQVTININSVNVKVGQIQKSITLLQYRVSCVEKAVKANKGLNQKFLELEQKFLDLVNSTKVVPEQTEKCCNNGCFTENIWSKWEQMKNFTVESCRHIMLIF